MIYFIDFKSSYIKNIGIIICECCAAYLEEKAISADIKHTLYFRHPITDINSAQSTPSRGITVSNAPGDVSKIRIEDVLDVINLGDNEKFYIQSSIEEYPFD